VLGLSGFQRGRDVSMAEEGGRAGGGDRVKLPQARTSASPAALRMKTDVVGAKACQRARHIRSYRTALRLGDRGRNDVATSARLPARV
jgi:hypothetical protein